MSTLTIELDNETEDSLKLLSLYEGRRQEEIAARLIANSIRIFPSSKKTEAQLLKKINEGWEEAKWSRYHKLVEIRKDESLTEEEYQELARLTNEREIFHADRLRLVLDLAKIWNVSWEFALERLGIGNTQSVE